ncbi:MAG: cob(I)yrinic acid a,c-diamide adenosyltransferase [Gemmatimonadota bacterium]
MSRIYTRTGDRGKTGLFGGGRVAKSDLRVAAYGDVDELNAAVGWARTRLPDGDEVGRRLEAVQADLFAIGAHLATPPGAPSREHLPPLPAERPAEMEAWIDAAEDELAPLRSFILPGGSEAGAALHLARTVCRRAERAIVALARQAEVDGSILVYMNRLSDLLFDLARLVNHRAGIPETPWQPQ